MSVSNGDFLDNSPDSGTTPMGEMMAGADKEAEEELEREEEERKGKKLPSAKGDKDEDKRVVNYLYMGKGLWNWIKSTSNSHGMKLERFIVHLLEKERKNWKPPSNEDSPETH